MPQLVNPVAGKTTDWRAGCGRSASPVRREGELKPIGPPYPYNSYGRYAADKVNGIGRLAGTVSNSPPLRRFGFLRPEGPAKQIASFETILLALSGLVRYFLLLCVMQKVMAFEELFDKNPFP
jgi:hypothetical protein